MERISTGSWVEVEFGGRTLQGVVRRTASWSGLPQKSRSVEIKSIGKLLDRTPVSSSEIRFWDVVARYYLCTTGEVFKAAYPILSVRQQEVSSHKKPEDVLSKLEDGFEEITLSEMGMVKMFSRESSLVGVKL